MSDRCLGRSGVALAFHSCPFQRWHCCSEHCVPLSTAGATTTLPPHRQLQTSDGTSPTIRPGAEPTTLVASAHIEMERSPNTTGHVGWGGLGMDEFGRKIGLPNVVQISPDNAEKTTQIFLSYFTARKKIMGCENYGKNYGTHSFGGILIPKILFWFV